MRGVWIVCLVFFAAGCHGRPTIQRTVPEATAAHHPVGPGSVSAPGVIEPWAGEVRLASAEPGQIAEIRVVEGQRIVAGELLARLEDSQQRHAVAIAEAEVRQAVAALDGTASTGEELRTAEAELDAASARAELVRRESARAAVLGEAGALPRVEVERTVSAARVEDATRQAAEARLITVKRGARRSDRQIARARLEAAEARLADTRAALARREVRATVEGVVIWSRYHPGEYYAQSSGPLFILGDLSRLQARLEVDDGDAARLEPGLRCQLRDDGGEDLGQGTVIRLAVEYGSRSLNTERPTMRTDARVREVFVEVDSGTTLAPGQRVWGHVPKGTLHARR